MLPCAHYDEPVVNGGVSRIVSWKRCSFSADRFQTTHDINGQDGGVDLGPRWSKVIRRITYDLNSGHVIADEDTKRLPLHEATRHLSGL